jgi:hypothetical protein
LKIRIEAKGLELVRFSDRIEIRGWFGTIEISLEDAQHLASELIELAENPQEVQD